MILSSPGTRLSASCLLVADSSVVTKDNLDEIAKQGLLMISRLPATFALEGELKEMAWEKNEIEALAYVLLLALLIHRILQRRVRKALETEGSHMVVAGGVKTTAPTGNRVLELLAPYHVACVQEEGREYRVIQEIPNEEALERILRLAGFTPDIYVVVRPSPYQRE